jgi:hypothetical protein
MSRYAGLTKAEIKKFDAAVERTVQHCCAGMQISILDIPKVFEAAREAYDQGDEVDGARIVEAIVSKYRELSQGGAA